MIFNTSHPTANGRHVGAFGGILLSRGVLLGLSLTAAGAFGLGVLAGSYFVADLKTAERNNGSAAVSKVALRDFTPSGSEGTMAGIGLDLADENQRLRIALESLREELVTAEKRNTEGALSDRLSFIEKFPHHLSLSSLEEGGTLSKAMSELLGLTEAEYAEVNTHLAAVLEELRGIEAKKIKVVEQSTQKTVLSIPAHTDALHLEQNLADLLRGAIGPRRAAILIARSEGEFARQFSGFGKTATEVEIDWSRGKPEQGAFYFEERYATKNGSGKTSSTTTILPLKYRGLIQVEPPR